MSQTKYVGGCHCGKVRFEVTLEVKEAFACNCSICSRVGWLLAFAPSDQFKLLAGEDALTDYQFGKKNSHHTFCTNCGIRAFSRGKGKGDTDWCAINLRCLDDFDTSAVPVKHVDGKSL